MSFFYAAYPPLWSQTPQAVSPHGDTLCCEQAFFVELATAIVLQSYYYIPVATWHQPFCFRCAPPAFSTMLTWSQNFQWLYRLLRVPCAITATAMFFGRVLASYDIRGMPVVDDAGKVLGLISCKEVGYDVLHRDARGQPFPCRGVLVRRAAASIHKYWWRRYRIRYKNSRL